MRFRTLLIFVAVLALAAAACAGDDIGAETTTTAVEGGTTSTAAPVEDTTTTTAATTSTAADEDTTTTDGGSSAELVALRDSLSRTGEATSGRMEGSITMTGISDLPAESFVLPFSGAFDNKAGSFSFVMDMSFMAGGEDIPPEMAGMFGEMEMRIIGETSYIRFPFFSLFLGTETEWIATPAEEGTDATGGLAGAMPGNPGDFLESFDEANGTVEELGRETLRGVETTHYLVVFDMEELLANATPEERAEIEAQGPVPIDQLPMELWISDDGLVHKYTIEMLGADLDLPEDEAFGSMIMVFEMFDYGADIVIEPPPADEVTNLDDLDFFGLGET